MPVYLGLDLGNAVNHLEKGISTEATPAGNEQRALALAAERQVLRKQRLFAQADALREQIASLGFMVEDTPEGPRFRALGVKAG